MNTTQRILALGTNPTGAIDFLLQIKHNNPLSGHWWMWIMENNPGGDLKFHNPEAIEEMLENAVAQLRRCEQAGEWVP